MSSHRPSSRLGRIAAFAALGLLTPLALQVEAEVPPVGLITLRGRPLTPITQRLVSLLRAVATERA